MKSKRPARNPLREVVISGVPYSQGEDLTKVIKDIARAKGVEVHEGDIVHAFRAINQEMTEKKSNPKIIVEWATNKKKQEFKRHRPNRLPAGGGGQQVYINENLTESQRLLFYKTRQLKKLDSEISHAWTRDGHCFIRTSGGEKIRVTDEADIEKLKNKQKKQAWLLATKTKKRNPGPESTASRVTTPVSRSPSRVML